MKYSQPRTEVMSKSEYASVKRAFGMKRQSLGRKSPNQEEQANLYKCFQYCNNYRLTAKLTGWSSKTVSRVVARWKSEYGLLRNPGSGRKRKTTAQEDRRLAREMSKDPHMTAKQAQEATGITQVSAKTVLRRCREHSKEMHSLPSTVK